MLCPVSYTHLDVYKRQPFVPARSPRLHSHFRLCFPVGLSNGQDEILHPAQGLLRHLLPSFKAGAQGAACLLYTS